MTNSGRQIRAAAHRAGPVPLARAVASRACPPVLFPHSTGSTPGNSLRYLILHLQVFYLTTLFDLILDNSFRHAPFSSATLRVTRISSSQHDRDRLPIRVHSTTRIVYPITTPISPPSARRFSAICFITSITGLTERARTVNTANRYT